ncbi:MAG: hypothetical protein IK140_04765 [Clostridia bacterium]|nr:hypothetical protein [Clostridia bacterium]
MQFLLKILRDFPGVKTVRYEFSFPAGKLAFMKILLAPYMPALRIKVGRAAAPPNHPEFRISEILAAYLVD